MDDISMLKIFLASALFKGWCSFLGWCKELLLLQQGDSLCSGIVQSMYQNRGTLFQFKHPQV